eukprot:CAMPEP_0198420384 /NCGR_PEP_ID=MMETSP1452-20131203/866_1 /TAXON_ID=1181717 /ORGANISM="Synchroma pusillum, Strain CCMP3072" /LENGTH=204 /DNA_ID=CAMNT_0044140541 /DNA_START=175 /DNA_END=787 /DNA_ORIENTATION=-
MAPAETSSAGKRWTTVAKIDGKPSGHRAPPQAHMIRATAGRGANDWKPIEPNVALTLNRERGEVAQGLGHDDGPVRAKAVAVEAHDLEAAKLAEHPCNHVGACRVQAVVADPQVLKAREVLGHAGKQLDAALAEVVTVEVELLETREELKVLKNLVGELCAQPARRHAERGDVRKVLELLCKGSNGVDVEATEQATDVQLRAAA